MQIINSQKVTDAIKEINENLHLLNTIGQGSIGTVYECMNNTGHSIAVKLMEITPMIDSIVFTRIIQAALDTRPLADKVNVVKVFSAGKTENFYFICMEMIHGSTLETLVNNQHVKLDEKLKIAAEIAKILAAIHSKGIVHKDLKPSNILLDQNNTPFLNDFYLFSSTKGQILKSIPHGTPYYMSPEQTNGQLVSCLTDVYSFGVLFYELLTGAMPYANAPKNISDMIKTVHEGNIIPPSKINKHIAPQVEAIILKLLEKDPQMRYQNMGAVEADIKAYIIEKSCKKSFISKILHLFR